MTKEEFISEYHVIAERAIFLADKARGKGLLALEDEIDLEKHNDRDILEYGLQLIVDGICFEQVDRILSNIVAQEEDKEKRTLKTIQKTIVLSLHNGDSPRVFMALVNSLSPLSLNDDLAYKKW
jgi:flagellar motor component MotA